MDWLADPFCICGDLESDHEDDSHQFVRSVCWNRSRTAYERAEEGRYRRRTDKKVRRRIRSHQLFAYLNS